MTDNEHLLKDVFGEAASEDFRRALLNETMRRVGRRRRVRQALGAVGAALLLVGLCELIRWPVAPPQTVRSPETFARCRTVQTEALADQAIVATTTFSPDRVVESVPFIQMVQTTATSGEFRIIDDDELLSLLAPRPAMLVRIGPNAEELVFADTD